MGASKGKARRKRAPSIATTANDAHGVLDVEAERRSIEEAIAGKSSYT